MPLAENSEDSSSPSDIHVVAVDDDPLILQAMGDYLVHFNITFESCGYTGDDCADFNNLLEGGGKAPDVIIADYRLPGRRNGLDVISELREHHGDAIPAILFTGDILLEETLPEEALAHIKLLYKPVRMKALNDEIRALLPE